MRYFSETTLLIGIVTLLVFPMSLSLARGEGRSHQQVANSPRLFYIPVAEFVGEYQATLSIDVSLLEELGILSSAAVLAIGIGELSQIEYRHTSAIGLSGGSVPLPTVGVQIKLPIDLGAHFPAVAIAYRLGIPHEESDAVEKSSDLYGVAQVVLPWKVDLHLGVRITQASITHGQNTRTITS